MGLVYTQAHFNNREKKIIKVLRAEKHIQTWEEFHDLYNADLYIVKNKRYRMQDSLRIKFIKIKKGELKEKKKLSIVRSTAT
jgi:hypothetical protein